MTRTFWVTLISLQNTAEDFREGKFIGLRNTGGIVLETQQNQQDEQKTLANNLSERLLME